MIDIDAILSAEGAAVALIAINFACFAAFGIDKMLAQGRHRRVAEADLLMMAFLGGTVGAYAGRHLFRHKTRKQPFSNSLHTIAIIHAALGAGLAVLFW